MEQITILYNNEEIYTSSEDFDISLDTQGTYLTGDIEVNWEDRVGTLEETEWSKISEIAQAGKAGTYWSVGDTKSIKLSGTCGTISLDTTLYVFIIGINHQSVNGITLQGFKTASSGGTDVCLADSKNGDRDSSGAKYFTLNHWGGSSYPYNTNYGGWKGCDARYDILGSTNTPPNGYGSIPETDRVGYDAGTTTATNPVPNTLMSCLPSDLRAVMRPMIIYTDNTGNASDTQVNVTTSVDYLPLLAEYEIFGRISYANQYEQNHQAQYAYYSAGNSTSKKRHSSTGITSGWWERSPAKSGTGNFCYTIYHCVTQSSASRSSYGLAPMFLV